MCVLLKPIELHTVYTRRVHTMLQVFNPVTARPHHRTNYLLEMPRLFGSTCHLQLWQF
jgi:hypothetical protein